MIIERFTGSRRQERRYVAEIKSRAHELQTQLLDQTSPLGFIITPRETQAQELRERVLARTAPTEVPFMTAVINFAGWIHNGQIRENGLPYIVHPLGVDQQMLDQAQKVGITIPTISRAKAILHDTREDYDGPNDEFARVLRIELGNRYLPTDVTEDLLNSTILFDKHELPAGEALPRLDKADLGWPKIVDRSNSAYGDFLRVLTAEAGTDIHTAAVARAKKSLRKLREVRWFSRSVPVEVAQELDAAIELGTELTLEGSQSTVQNEQPRRIWTLFSSSRVTA